VAGNADLPDRTVWGMCNRHTGLDNQTYMKTHAQRQRQGVWAASHRKGAKPTLPQIGGQDMSVFQAETQCDLHRREAEEIIIRDMIRGERMRKRNRAEWQRRAIVAIKRGDLTMAIRLLEQAQID